MDEHLKKFDDILKERLALIHPMISKTYQEEKEKINDMVRSYVRNKFSELQGHFTNEIKETLIKHQMDMVQKFTEEISRVHEEAKQIREGFDEKLKRIRYKDYERLVKKASKYMKDKEIKEIFRTLDLMKKYWKQLLHFSERVNLDIEDFRSRK